jgi:hypothetical protein
MATEDHKARCRSCNAEVYFAFTPKGKIACIFADPVENGGVRDVRTGKAIEVGNVRLHEDEHPYSRGRKTLLATYVSPNQTSMFDEENTYVDHHVNCPQASRW